MRYYRLRKVATALNISTSTIVDILNGNGYELENKPTSKISEDQLDLLAEIFAINFDKSFKEYGYSESSSTLGDYNKLLFSILEQDERLKSTPIFSIELIPADWFEGFSSRLEQEYRETNNGIAFFKRLFKRAIIGFKLKKTYLNIKLLILSIITPRLFHVFTSEDDNNSVALQFSSPSIDFVKNLEEACLNFFSFKTRLTYEGQEYIN